MSLSDFKTQRVNANKHTERGIKALDNSITKDGWIGAVTVAADGETFDGSARLEALADAMPSAEPIVIESDGTRPVIVKRTDIPDTDDPRAKRLGVAANVIAHMDYAPDGEILAMIAADDDAVARLIKQDELSADAVAAALADGLLGDADAEPQIDRAAELNEKWQVQRGDLWRIGEHRLLCGDSTKREDVERVMQWYKADMIFTDPPYNVASESRNYAADKSKAMRDLEGADWDHDFDFSKVIPSLDSVMANDCAVYICTSHWLVQRIWEWMWSWSDFCSYCVWCKPNPMPSLSKRHWTWATELIPYAVRGKHVSNFPADGHALNWWNIAKSKDTDHPTEKVIEVPARAISFSSNADQIVADFFAGSGTTLVACQNLQRKCRAIEISPNYCAVILERMTMAFPGIEIERVSNGTA